MDAEPTDAETVAELLARDRRSDAVAIVDRTGRAYDRHWLCTSSWKAGNYLRHAGVRRDVAVGVVGDGPLALLSFFGTALLEGRTRFDPPVDLAGAGDLRALVAPADAVPDYDLPRGGQRIGYGTKPDDPDVRHFEAELWSENPSFPPLEIDPGTAVLADGDRTYTHGAVVAAARRVVDEWGLETGTRVAVRAPLSDPRTIAAGVVAPLLAGGVAELTDVDPDRPAVVVDDGASTVPLESVALESDRA